MKIAVISDLHLGAADAADEFGHDDAEFLKFLDVLEAEHEQIILLGDIYETLTADSGPGAYLEALSGARKAHAEIFKRFQRSNYRYIHGNHDHITRTLEGAPTELWIEADGTRLLFTHGHVHDWVFRRAQKFAEVGVWLGALVRRIGLGAVYKLFQKAETYLNGSSTDPARCRFQRWATHLARHRGADVIVTGHTHEGRCVEHGRRLFMNSGSCSEGQFAFLSMDTRAGRYGYHTSW